MAFKDWYTFRLVDLQGNVVREQITGVTGGSVDANVAAEIRWSGSINLEAPPDWDQWKTRIQPIYHRTGRDPEVVGTFHARPETGQYAAGRHSTTLALYDLTIHPQEDESVGMWTESKGANIAHRVRTILQTIGLKVSVTPNDEKLRTAIVFDEIVSKLHIINALLDAGGFFALHTNPLGQFQVRPYDPPQQRPIAYVLGTRSDAEHTDSAEWEYPQTLPNKVTARARGDGDSPDLRATAYDHADFAQTGVWRSKTYDVDASSQSILAQHARRLLATARQTSTVQTRQILPRPLAPNDIISDRTGSRFTVETIRRVFQSGQLMTVGMREVKEV